MDQSVNIVVETYRFCPRCAARVEVDRVQIDDKLTCHACGNEFAVARGPNNQARVGQGRAEQKKERKRKSAERVFWSREAMQTSPPLGFFLAGCFDFPFRLDNLLRTLALGATAAVLIGAVRLAFWCLGMEDEAVAQGVRVLIWNGMLLASVLGVFAATILLYLASAYGLTIFHDTAHGADIVESWPRVLLFEDLGSAVYVTSGLLMASLPGILPGGIWRITGVPRSWAIVVGLAALFPIVLLSSLESKSPLGPFSPPVWRSVLLGWRVWLRFYVVSFVALGVGAAAFLFLYRYGGSAVGVAGAGLVAAAVWIIYMRLVGRLAWFCSGRWVMQQS